MGLTERVGPGRVALDASVFIYFVERHPAYLPIVRPLFVDASAGRRALVTSAVTLREVLVTPLRAGDAVLTARYEYLLTRAYGLRLVDVDQSQLRLAAELRARHGVRTPDALASRRQRSAGQLTRRAVSGS